MIPAPTRETWIPFTKEECVPDLPMEFTGEPVRHLMYHIWPAGTTRRWQWNIAELKKRIELFNGLRIVGIAVDDHTATAEEVVQEFGDTRIDYWYVTKNDPVLGEMSTFLHMARLLPSGPNDVSAYMHAKGVRHNPQNGIGVLIWTEVMYRLMLDNWPHVFEQMKKFKAVGPFKNTYQFQISKHSRVCLDGNFWWIRNQQWFNRKGWTDLPLIFIGVEAAVSRAFDVDEIGTLFAEYSQPGSFLYQRSTWELLKPLLSERGIEIELPPGS